MTTRKLKTLSRLLREYDETQTCLALRLIEADSDSYKLTRFANAATNNLIAAIDDTLRERAR